MRFHRNRPGRKPAAPANALSWAAAKFGLVRGSATITTENRGGVRFWLTANGVPSEHARSLPCATLAHVWNDTTDAALRALLAECRADTTSNTADDIPDSDPDTLALDTTTTTEPRHTMTSTTTPNPDDAAALAAILSRMAKPALDESAVRALVHQEAGAAIDAATQHALANMRADFNAALEAIASAPRELRVILPGRTVTMPREARHPMFDALLTLAAIAHEPGALCPMLVGPAGSGKTHGAAQVAVALGRPFYTSGAATGSHEYLGFKDGAGQYHATPFRQAFEHGGVFLADEMDRSDPAALMVLNSALANGFMGFPDRAEPVRRHSDFVLIVAANTFGRGADRLYVGANQLDGSTLDRLAPLAWDYDEALERTLAGDDAWTAYVQAARNAAMEQKARVIISPRASMGGALMRRTGALSFAQIADLCIWKGMEAEQRARIERAIPDSIRRAAERPPVLSMQKDAA